MAKEHSIAFDEDGFSAKKTKIFRVVAGCIVVLGIGVGVLFEQYFNNMKRVGDAWEEDLSLVDSETISTAATDDDFSTPTVVRTKYHLSRVHEALASYALVHTNQLPETLSVLVEMHKLTREDVCDAWGQPFVYVIEDASLGRYTLRSVGKDGRPSTDDIAVSLDF